MPITEKPILNTVEIWSLVNLTSEVHPIHLHQARVQILDRQGFDPPEYLRTEKIRYTGPRVPPEVNEAGWKDTVRANGRSVTRIIVRFDGYPGRYLWHCHILEHSAKENCGANSDVGSGSGIWMTEGHAPYSSNKTALLSHEEPVAPEMKSGNWKVLRDGIYMLDS